MNTLPNSVTLHFSSCNCGGVASFTKNGVAHDNDVPHDFTSCLHELTFSAAQYIRMGRPDSLEKAMKWKNPDILGYTPHPYNTMTEYGHRARKQRVRRPQNPPAQQNAL